MAIVKRPAYVISSGAGTDPNDPIIGYNTVTFDYDCSDIAVSTEAEDFPRDAPLEPNTYETWKPTALPATWEITFDSGTDVDFVGIAGHTFGTDQISVLVEYKSGGAYTTFAAQVNPSTDAPLLFLDSSVTADTIRITLSATQSPSSLPQMGVVYIGERLSVQRRIYGGHAPTYYQRTTDYSTMISRGGHFLDRSIRKKGVGGSVDIDNITATWFRDNFDDFSLHARQYPFFFAWRPTKYPLEIIYAMTTEDIQPVNSGVKDLMQISMNLIGVGFNE